MANHTYTNNGNVNNALGFSDNQYLVLTSSPHCCIIKSNPTKTGENRSGRSQTESDCEEIS